MNWDMGKVDCPIVSIMEHIHACFSVCAEITGIGSLSCKDFIDVTDPVALNEAIYRDAHSNSSCGLGRNPGVFFWRARPDVGCVQLSITLAWWCNLVGGRSIYGRNRYPRGEQEVLRMKYFGDSKGSS
jgi:hypothetical protein